MKTGERPAATITTPRAKVTLTKDQVIADYRLAVRSRAASEIGRREVLGGRAPFGIFGDGKEIANLGLAHAFRPGDWRSGYYRDQTFMLAVGLATFDQYFAQLYADADLAREPFSAGRQMSNHYATRTVDDAGQWRDLLVTGQVASDISPVAAHVPRAVGLAWASKLYRNTQGLRDMAAGFSRQQAVRALLPLTRQTLGNFERIGGPASWTGPASRGDLATIRKHLAALRRFPREYRAAYAALTRLSVAVLTIRLG